MTKLRVQSFSLSLDGYGAGPHQDLANPLVGGISFTNGSSPPERFRRYTDVTAAQRASTTTLRHAVSPISELDPRAEHVAGSWPLARRHLKGWWGDNPPYHTPVFVLTNHPRPSITMDGGTVFHFVADGINAALTRATEVANGQDVRLGGGVSTVRQYLRAALIDKMHWQSRPRPPRLRRAPSYRYRRTKTRLSVHRTRCDRERHSRSNKAWLDGGDYGGQRKSRGGNRA